jgi:hypothetical protein
MTNVGDTVQAGNNAPDTGPYVRVLWTLGEWRCVFTGASVLLYVGEFHVSARQVATDHERDHAAEDWRRSVQAIVNLEQATDLLPIRLVP